VLFFVGGLALGAWSLALIGGLLFFLVGAEERAVKQRLESPPSSAPTFGPPGPAPGLAGAGRLVWLKGPEGWVLVRVSAPPGPR